MERRGFLFLCGSVVTGLSLGGRLTTLSRQLVLALGGACSFCGNAVAPELAMAGALGLSERMCRDCVAFALAILGDAEPLLPKTIWD